MAANITLAYQYCITKCNDPNVGYSQDYRTEQTVNGVTYYDCSSLMWYALKNAGFDVAGAYGSSYPFVTDDMGDVLLALGFVIVPIDSEWMPGDILWRSGHTEMVYQGRRTMGAHTDSYELVDQVSINTYNSSPSSWSICYRYQGGAIGSYEWITGNRYLSMEEMQNNALCVLSYLYPKGWTLNAIAGMLGNMQTESNINPGIWQSLDEGNTSLGYGLVQWTPATNYLNWADAQGYERDDGDMQLYWIHNLTTSEGQWIPTAAYDLSFESFRTSTQSPEYLASAFLKNFERAGTEVEEERQTQARYWYDYLIVFLESGGFFPSTSKKKKTGYNFILFNRKRRMRTWQC